jgi:hypothetical protein
MYDHTHGDRDQSEGLYFSGVAALHQFGSIAVHQRIARI